MHMRPMTRVRRPQTAEDPSTIIMIIGQVFLVLGTALTAVAGIEGLDGKK